MLLFDGAHAMLLFDGAHAMLLFDGAHAMILIYFYVCSFCSFYLIAFPVKHV